MGLRKPNGPEVLREVVTRDPGRDLPGLLRQLSIGDVPERRWAARDLAQFAESAPALGERLLQEADSSVRESLLTSLETIGTQQAVASLLPLLRSEDPQLRNGAIEALSGMADAVAPQVDALLRDPDADVRIFTVNLLGDLKHPDLNRWLAAVLESETQVNVVAAAVEVVTEVGTPEVVPALRKAVVRFAHDPFLSFAVDMAIERIEST